LLTRSICNRAVDYVDAYYDAGHDFAMMQFGTTTLGVNPTAFVNLIHNSLFATIA